MHVQQENNNTVADEVDPELLAKRKRKRYCLGIKDRLSLKSTVKSVLEMKLWKRELMEDNRYDQKDAEHRY